MKREFRLRTRRDFDRVFAARQSRPTPLLVAHLRLVRPLSGSALASPGPRLGISVSKKVGGAVVRNRIKRRLREIWGQLLPSLDPRWDVVVLARPPAAQASSSELATALRGALAGTVARAS